MGNTGKGIAIFLILGLIIFYFYYTEKSPVPVITGVTKTFAGGETIQFFDPPKVDIEGEIDNLNKLAIENFGQPFLDLPFESKLQMIKILENHIQQNINGGNYQLVNQDAVVYDNPPNDTTNVNGTVSGNNTSVEPTESNVGGIVSVSYTGLTENLSSQSSDSTIVKRGEIARILGKITKNANPPYEYGVSISCCNADPITTKNNLLTDNAGAFEYNFATHGKRPLGDYSVELSTIADNGRTLLKWYYYFRLVE